MDSKKKVGGKTMRNLKDKKLNAEEVATIEEMKQILRGTDDRSLAQGLAIAFLNTLLEAGQEITECLCEGECNALGMLKLIKDNISFVQHNLSGIGKMVKDFNKLCEEIRKEDEE